ncbi:Sodium channel, voltage-gated, type IX, alpha subunit [Cichlidogyrus casuarinus]|uniref:Sodium channel protein n=1 Tax=Cichlidogyrus casuarinus TaxID=1844966 RepID=A0ABD2PWZ0_9PLAT
MNLLFAIIGRTLGALGNLTLVVIICIFVFAIVGMSLFGDAYKTPGEHPRLNFEDFPHSFMVVFRVLCGEWIESMWDCLRVTNGQPSCIIFFLVTMIFGNLVVLNLFLALLLSCFGTESLLQRENENPEPNKLQIAFERIYRAIIFTKIQLVKVFKMGICCLKNRLCPVRPEQSKNHSVPRENGTKMASPSKKSNQNSASMEATMSLLGLNQQKNENQNGQQNGIAGQKMELVSGVRENSIPSLASCTPRQSLHEIKTTQVEAEYWDQPDDCLPKCIQRILKPLLNPCMQSSLGRFYKWARNIAYSLVEHKYFEAFIIVMILLSSVTLVFEDKNLKKKPKLHVALDYLDKYFTIVFTLEMLIKWLAYGVRKYFKDAWCWLDFAIVMIALASFALTVLNPESNSSNMSSFKAMRTLRALRPLRAVSRWELMRIVVNALFQAIPAIFHVFLVIIVFWLIFSIMGMQLFGGKFRKCIATETNEALPANSFPNKTFCLQYEILHKNVSWRNSKINFDNVLNGYLALLQVATFKGWLEIMNNAVDIVDTDMQPIKNYRKANYFYFILFIIFGAFFTLNLFIGVIIDNFNVQKRKAGGSIEMFLTDEQKKYYNAMKKMSNTAPQKPIPRPRFRISRLAFDVVTNQKFDLFIMCIILLNTFIMCIEHHGQSEEFHKNLETINRMFIVIFVGEFLFKFIGQRWYYFKNYWNIFDFTIVIFSVVCWAVETIAIKMMDRLPISPTVVRIVRLFRIGRVLRLVKSARGIRTLLFALIVSLPALVNIGVLLFLVMFIYAIIGMSFFGNLRYSAGVTEDFNFETFYQAIIILFQISTSAGWNEVLEAIINDSEECNPENERPKRVDCANYTTGVLYIVSYLIISYLVIVNMYIAVILENFSQATEDVKQGLTQDDFDQFYEVCF